jgi:hypothetical protein
MCKILLFRKVCDVKMDERKKNVTGCCLGRW